MHIESTLEGRRHARLHVAHLDCTSDPSPSASPTGLCRLSALSDGRDHETYSRRSGTVLGTSQVAILQDVEVAWPHRVLYLGQPVEATSQAPLESPQSPQRPAVEDRH